MRPGKPSYGELIAGVSAVLLFVFMFFDWYGDKCVNTGNLLFYISCSLPGKSAWEALDYIPSVLVVCVCAALITTALRISDVADKLARIHAVVGALGVVSAALILIRILDAPSFGSEPLGITYEGTVQFPIYLALAAAVGIAIGSFLAIEEERLS